jgi:hypothetical protein
VFNPNQSSDEEKTPTKILFDNDGNFLEFGAEAERKYAEIVDEGETAYMFQTVSAKFFDLKTYYSIKWRYFVVKRM